MSESEKLSLESAGYNHYKYNHKETDQSINKTKFYTRVNIKVNVNCSSHINIFQWYDEVSQ